MDVQPAFDSDWRRQALSGDAEAVRTFAEAVLEPLYHFCLHRLGRDRYRCEEVVQETLVRALRELEHYDPPRAGNHVFPWLTGLARNEISRTLVREKHTVSLNELWLRMDAELLALYERLESAPLADDVLEREETRELVNVTMSQLPARYREVLEAKYVRGASVRDLATLGRTSEKAVESLLSRARRGLPRRLPDPVPQLARRAGGVSPRILNPRIRGLTPPARLLFSRNRHDGANPASRRRQRRTSRRSGLSPRPPRPGVCAPRSRPPRRGGRRTTLRAPAPQPRRLLAVAGGLAAVVALIVLPQALWSLFVPRTAEVARTTPAEETDNYNAERLSVLPRGRTPLLETLALGSEIHTGAGQRRCVRLPDGTVLSLNENTAARLDADRRLSLSKGEVFVEVAPRSDGRTPRTLRRAYPAA